MTFWLLKSEPDVWSIDQQIKAGKKGSPWDGVRNYQAANNLKNMKFGDLCFFYHSNIWEEAINLDSHHKESLNGIGSAFKKVKKYERAIEYLKKALKVDSNFFDAYYNLANVYLELTNYEQSIIYFKQAYKLKPNFIKIIYGIGYSLMKDLDYEGALRYFFQYLEKDDKNSEIFNFIGICLNKLRRYEESINYYCKSLELDSKNAHSVDNLLNLFTYYEPKKYKNFIVKINSEVKELNKNFDLNKK